MRSDFRIPYLGRTVDSTSSQQKAVTIIATLVPRRGEISAVAHVTRSEVKMNVWLLGWLISLPGIIAMSVHKLFCAIAGSDFEDAFLGIWIYRLIGLPLIGILLAILGAIGSATVAIWSAVAIGGIVLWARFTG